MSHEALCGEAFDALGEANRRAVVELLRAGDRSARELADALRAARRRFAVDARQPSNVDSLRVQGRMPAEAESATTRSSVRSAYPGVCIPPPPDLKCRDIPHRGFLARRSDPHNFREQ